LAVNKQNFDTGTMNNPCRFMKNVYTVQKLVWCSMSAFRITEPYLHEEGNQPQNDHSLETILNNAQNVGSG
jgi:hypothetical protein